MAECQHPIEQNRTNDSFKINNGCILGKTRAINGKKIFVNGESTNPKRKCVFLAWQILDYLEKKQEL